MRGSYPHIAMRLWCALFGYSRQHYYQQQQVAYRWQCEVVIILELVKAYRAVLPRTGTRKLYHALKADFSAAGIKLGRDGLHELLCDEGLIIAPKRRKTRTTLTYAWMRRYPDLRLGLQVQASELLWVADITYLRTRDGFVYLSLITDAYCRMIVGWHCHPSLEAEGCLACLDMALAHRRYPERKLIHHSDRGAQYGSQLYTERLMKHHISISMTQQGSPYENPLAESVNGQLKVELGLDGIFDGMQQAQITCREQITKYNTLRLHGSIDYLRPVEAYDLTQPIAQRWHKPKDDIEPKVIRTAEHAVNLLQDEMICVNPFPDGIS